ncbi:GTP-binding and nucleic acid-binding protein YchF [hydrothermal vent metagenome]|uniref:GTP-binding and nucleic acid-binding protein YchF n=1 Tax=hydrothermal vent metagenome TaxID=652676 RepID=A0A3B1BM16_9ZZZZ
MGFNCGVVGLPNVGKSTIFNALTAAGASAENFPFCTIEPNVGIVPVPDSRLNRLAEISQSKKIAPTTLEVVDIAGLVAGASKGEGLGNKFLGHIRQVDAIAHVVRCFADDNVTHVSGAVNPESDINVIKTELILSDIETIEKRISACEKGKKSGDKKMVADIPKLVAIRDKLNDGLTARQAFEEGDAQAFRELFLITAKPILYVCNIGEDEIGQESDNIKAVRKLAEEEGARVAILSGKIESELIDMEPDERKEFLTELGLKESGLDAFIREGYAMLNLITYLTTGPMESRAWTVRNGAKAPEAAGVIHSDFERGFIKAEVIKFEDIDRLGSEAAVKEKGLMRMEGKEYVVEDGDVMHYKFNV